MRALWITCLLLPSCCPTLVGSHPGDAGDLNWTKNDLPTPSSTPPRIIDCGGKEIGSLGIRTSHTVVRDCIIKGNVRIWGPARNASGPKLVTQSRSPDYVKWIRANSPTGVLIEDTTIIATGSIPLYVGPGVTFTTLRRVSLRGPSSSTMIYLGAESYGTTIESSLIDAHQAAREAVAIDASSHNLLRSNAIQHNHGGVYLYRNCGEGGTIRHTTPSFNTIVDNVFTGDQIAIYVGSREGSRCYCQEDQGFPFGSSISDMDHARFNIVRGNALGEGRIEVGKHATDNQIKGNQLASLHR